MDLVCDLCPRGCRLAPGDRGSCHIRVNLEGKIRAVTYGFPCSIHTDPIEKKPLFHFLPGTRALSLATVGCTMHCLNCQNWEISQADPEDVPASELPPERIPDLAREQRAPSVAYTYTDPAAWYEYAIDGCRACRAADIRNVLVTAAHINIKPWRELCRWVDAANIDIKAMSERFYREVCDGNLKPVLAAVVAAKELGVHVEITNLVIPTLNDSDEDLRSLCRWVLGNLGPDTPLHFSRFFPQHKMRKLPPTPEATLSRAYDLARAEGLRHIYVGNLRSELGQDTECPQCHAKLVQRRGFAVLANRLKDGRCPDCHTVIHGVWDLAARPSEDRRP